MLDVLLEVVDGGLKLEEALPSLRLHHQWQPDEVYFDSAPSASLRESLERRGHKISEKRRTGIVQAILRTKDGWLGVSDPRKDGEPRGY